MKVLSIAILILSFVVSGLASNPLSDLEKLAKEKLKAKPRVAFAEVNEIKNADPLETANVPNYIKALAQSTKAAPQFANLVQAFLFGGTIAPETKMAMGLKIAQIYSSPYLFAHTSRWLRTTGKGQDLLKNWDDQKTFTDAEKQAIEYAQSALQYHVLLPNQNSSGARETSP